MTATCNSSSNNLNETLIFRTETSRHIQQRQKHQPQESATTASTAQPDRQQQRYSSSNKINRTALTRTTTAILQT